MTPSIDTDLVTPLAAYLRLREGARASFLLESVDQGRLGRHSFVGCGDRLVEPVRVREADETVAAADERVTAETALVDRLEQERRTCRAA